MKPMHDTWSTQQNPPWPPRTPPPPQQQPGQPGQPWQPRPEVRDDATRLLCGATHLDAAYAGQLVREFLAEPLRAVAPSPGVDSPAVLREAVAALTRRRWRDGVLAALLLVVLLSNLTLFGMWLVVAALWKAFGLRRRSLDGVARPRMELVPLGLVLLLGLSLGAAGILSAVADLTGLAPDGYGQSTGGLLARTTLSMLAGLAAGAVLVADRYLIWSLLSRRFQRGRFVAHPGGGQLLRTMGSNGVLGKRLAGLPADGGRNVVVYRGNRPFVGWGRTLGTWSITIPMESAESEDGSAPRHRQPPAAFRLSELYDYIGADLEKLRQSSPALSPSFRLSELQQFETLMIPADDLVRHFGEEAANLVLARPERRPALRIDPTLVKAFAERPLEWMRYYRGFQVEAWDRDLVVSLFVHVGADRDMLYFECTPCVLPPVSPVYRRIDSLADESSVAPLLDALGSLVVLPVSIFTRLANAFRPTRSPGTGGGRFTSDRYGARSSVRELAADPRPNDYLMLRDLDRYMTLMQDRIFSATAGFLQSKGISSTRFTEKVRTIQNYFDQRNAFVSGGVFGSGNTVTNTPAPGSDAAPGKSD